MVELRSGSEGGMKRTIEMKAGTFNRLKAEIRDAILVKLGKPSDELDQLDETNKNKMRFILDYILSDLVITGDTSLTLKRSIVENIESNQKISLPIKMAINNVHSNVTNSEYLNQVPESEEGLEEVIMNFYATLNQVIDKMREQYKKPEFLARIGKDPKKKLSVDKEISKRLANIIKLTNTKIRLATVIDASERKRVPKTIGRFAIYKIAIEYSQSLKITSDSILIE
jgi:ribosome-binding ATPase YchF (GTP1/OBG family)